MRICRSRRSGDEIPVFLRETGGKAAKLRMKPGVLYIHGRGGSAAEAARFLPLFPGRDVVGMDYQAATPWEAKEEFRRFYGGFAASHGAVTLVANSIGAYFAMHALNDVPLEKAYFISPVADMATLIEGMMAKAGVSEEELCARGTVDVGGEVLSWKYLTWVRAHPVVWRTPTAILYGSADGLQSGEVIGAFAARIGASLTVMEGGEHWFHTPEQMRFLDAWLRTEENG